MKIESYKDLEVWKRSLNLVKGVYELSKGLRGVEKYGLASQMQRSAVSIPSNIAEGYARKGTAEYLRFLSIAYGSAAELETQIIIVNQTYPHLETAPLSQLVIEVQKMLFVLIKKLEAKLPKR